MCSKPTFCSKIAQKRKICSRLLEPEKFAPNAKSCSKVAGHNRERPTVVEAVECSHFCALQWMTSQCSRIPWEVAVVTGWTHPLSRYYPHANSPHFPHEIWWENLIKDRSIFSSVVILIVLITFSTLNHFVRSSGSATKTLIAPHLSYYVASRWKQRNDVTYGDILQPLISCLFNISFYLCLFVFALLTFWPPCHA